jgi:hypothetical protein
VGGCHLDRVVQLALLLLILGDALLVHLDLPQVALGALRDHAHRRGHRAFLSVERVPSRPRMGAPPHPTTLGLRLGNNRSADARPSTLPKPPSRAPTHPGGGPDACEKNGRASTPPPPPRLPVRRASGAASAPWASPSRCRPSSPARALPSSIFCDKKARHRSISVNIDRFQDGNEVVTVVAARMLAFDTLINPSSLVTALSCDPIVPCRAYGPPTAISSGLTNDH